MVIDEEHLIGLLTRLVDTPSACPDEYEVTVFLEKELARLGLSAQRIPIAERRFNLLCRIGSGSPVLCLNAHADTVSPSGNSIPKARIEGGVMYGLGSADDKASISAMIGAVKAMLDSGAKLGGTLDLLISVDEEGMGSGVCTAIEQGYRCDMAIIGEPTSLEIVPTHSGLIFLDIVTFGKATHGSIPMEGINAIDRMNELVSGLRALLGEYPAHPLLGPPSLNLGMIQAGDRPNRVPDRCEASVDIRIVPPMTVQPVLDRIDAYFGEWHGKAEYEVTKSKPTLDTPHDSPVIGALISAGQVVRGTAPKIVGWRGWTDAESFRTGLGIDAVVFGAGSLSQAHSSDEFVELAEVLDASRVYAQTALDLLG
jgi:succinyl-diaminopimelate desuccinylase